MTPLGGKWELTILGVDPPAPVTNLNSLAVGDLDADGHLEIIFGGHGGLFWYRPETFQQGIIAIGDFSVGLAVEDIDGDGQLEVVAAEGSASTSTWWITWYKFGGDIERPWARYVIDPACAGLAHDIVFADVDGDGHRELVANSVFCSLNGIFIYRPTADVTAPWLKHLAVANVHAEGLAVADITGDGRIEIVNGPDFFTQPASGPYGGLWHQTTYAPDFREMCRVLLYDITGNELPDIVTLESEYRDGKFAWFENRLDKDPANAWVEHRLEKGLVFAHSLDVWRSAGRDEKGFFLAEMAEGGWGQPYNYDARLIRYSTNNNGQSWAREELDQGSGTHQAVVVDIDGDGQPEVVGKEWKNPRLQLWKRAAAESSAFVYRHRFIDRDKPYTGIEIFAADVNEDGLPDVVCGGWWYKNPTWERHAIAEIYQAIAAGDIDSDGRLELIAIRKPSTQPKTWYGGLSSELCWVKAVDAEKGRWEVHPIGSGKGDWPHGALLAPVLPDGKLALLLAYHGAYEHPEDCPQIFEVPSDPLRYPWPKRTLAEIQYSENFVAADIDGNGALDIVAGIHWLQNLGDGTFRPHRITEETIDVARCAVADVNANGHPDIIIGEAKTDYEMKRTPLSRLMWFENPGGHTDRLWNRHIIDLLRYPHSIATADLKGNGQAEIVCAEHDPFDSYRNRGRLFVYARVDHTGDVWKRYSLDDRFEHHCGTVLADLGSGHPSILSHAWGESRYVHLWELH
jgi:hypothetical protein